MENEAPVHERALKLFVYAPVGVALYVRDMLPTMMGMFVSRGKREVDARLPGNRQPGGPAGPVPGPADVRRKVEEGIGIARVAAESGVGIARDLAGVGFGVARGAAEGAFPGFASPRDTAPAAGAAATAARPSAPTAAPTSPMPPTAPTDAPPDVDALPIPDYDELSASQVVERLDGLDPTSLEAIRRYEGAHRGRNTILGKIAQLT